MGSLRAVAEFLGMEVTYPWLMGCSGAAFRVCWSDNWSLEMTYSAPEDVVANGARAIGLSTQGLLNLSPDETWVAITESLDSSIPALSCGLAGAPEFCVIYGYEDEPQSLYVTSYFQEEGEVPFKPWMGWNYEGYGQFPLVLLKKVEPQEGPPTEEGLRRALRFSRGEGPLVAKARQRGLHFGLEAYEAWVDALREVKGDLESPAFNMALNLTALLDARRTAGEYLQIVAAMREDLRKPLMRASEHYRHQVSALAEARRILYYMPDLPEEAASKAAARLASGPLRTDYSRCIRSARQEERLSLEWIEKALEG